MILLTGGSGFIGSHAAVEFINAGYDIIIIDNLSNSTIDVVDQINKITQKPQQLIFYEGDITNKKLVDELFKTHTIETIIHFAAYKSVGESVEYPLKYYQNNVGGLLTLLNISKKYNINNFIFSSSATVYGDPEELPLKETSDLKAINPYGQTKLMCENILKDIAKANPNFKVILLRYFNPVGAHESGLIGEKPQGKPNNLFPYILEVINGKRTHLNIFGSDYDTYDGTGVRDYIHVVDLAKGHLAAYNSLLDSIVESGDVKSGDDNIGDDNNISIYNLGTGRGYSVLDIVETFNRILSEQGDERRVTYKFTDRRDGDSAAVYSDCSLANKELNWSCCKTLDDMIRDSINYLLHFHMNNISNN